MKNRRSFIKSTGIVAGGLWLSPSLLQAKQSIAASDRVRVALIGCNNMGFGILRHHIAMPEVDCVALCDVDQNVLDRRIAEVESATGKKPKRYTDYRTLLERNDVDAVIIGTPDHWHCLIAVAACQAGKDVYVEKPFSSYVTEGRDLCELLKEHPQIVQIGSQQRSEERFLIAAAAVRQGLIGELRGVEVTINSREGNPDPWTGQPVPPELDYDMWLGPVPWMDYHPDRLHYNFRFMPEIGSGEIANWGAHHLDIVQLALGMDDSGPVFVNGGGRRNPPGARHYSFFGIDVDYKYANGVKMKLRSCSSSDNSGIYFFGSMGNLFVSREEVSTSPKELIRSFPRDLVDLFRKTRGGHLSNWIGCMKTRRAEDLHAPAEVGHRSATICHMANIAIELGRPLNWDPEKEVFISDGYANAMLNRPVRKGWEI